MAEWLHRYAPLTGLTVHYVDQGEGPLLVLCQVLMAPPECRACGPGLARDRARPARDGAPFYFIGSVQDVDLEAWHGEEPPARIADQYEDVRRIEMVTGAGHLMQLERSDEVTRLMAAFLDDIAGRDASP